MTQDKMRTIVDVSQGHFGALYLRGSCFFYVAPFLFHVLALTGIAEKSSDVADRPEVVAWGGLRYPLVRGPCRGLLKRALQELKSSEVASALLEAGSQRGESLFGRVSARLCLWVGSRGSAGMGLFHHWVHHWVLVVQSRTPAFRSHRPPGLHFCACA